MAPEVTRVTINEPAQAYEDKHVHEVYDQIAPHFSSTRYKPWPIIGQFLCSIPTGWVGLDSGTGNGKYLSLPADRPGDIWTIGLDRSRNLLQHARCAGSDQPIREVVLGDILGSNWRAGVFDYAISIATIHHLVTPERRRAAVQRLLETVSPNHGRILIYVWAMEQDPLSKRRLPESDVGSAGLDVAVPWVLTGTEQVFNRYYHMFAKGELVGLVLEAAATLGLEIGSPSEGTTKSGRGVEIVQDGWERSNYYVELRCWRTQV
ncbi:hypothetical protein BDN72DRAFT_836590 [Pluteus cervinus]|uniref:Uncharacterized protein n=1 Tax=Pluteus cervinus TaxID=181527 RepID=A0ACD3B2I7_9AGAR|nr:hypothetical protein BDN72DRAFT_836590 [Pluteus cervinus]